MSKRNAANNSVSREPQANPADDYEVELGQETLDSIADIPNRLANGEKIVLKDMPLRYVVRKKKPKRTLKPQKPSLKVVSHLEDKLKDLTQGLPEDYRGMAAALAPINHACRQHFAKILAPALNAEIRAMPHDDLDQKKAVAEWVNSEVGRFGLAVECPKTGQPAQLKGDVGDWPGVGRFQFQIYQDGKRVRSCTTNELPELRLIDADLPREPESPWQNKVGPKSSRTGRKLTD